MPLRWIILLETLGAVLAKDRLYYTSVRQRETSGLYGGYLDGALNGSAKNLDEFGTFCADIGSSGIKEGLDIRSVSYDPYTQQALIQLQSLSYTRTTAFITSVCDPGPPKCKETKARPLFVAGETTDAKEGNIGPLAVWNNVTYFIADRYESLVESRTILHTIQLRKLEGCEQKLPFTTRNKINLDECSSFVAELGREIGQDLGFEVEDTLLAARHLHIIPWTEDGVTELFFVVQIQNQTFNDDFDVEKFSMKLISASESTGKATLLHEERLPDEFAENELDHLGDIDYLDGTLCWSMLDRLLCAKWQVENWTASISNIQRIVEAEGASSVCGKNVGYTDGGLNAMAQISGADTSTMITGVAIGQGVPDFIVYFGCYVGPSPTYGGAGIARKLGDKIITFPLKDSSGLVRAGSMFVACRENSPYFTSTAVGYYTATRLSSIIVWLLCILST